MLRILSSLTLLCLLSVPDPHADWHSYLQKCETKYRAARHLKVTFLERYSENNRTVRVESGQAYFQKPGKMRWEYVQPEENLFLVDGKFTWFYSPADRTATRLPLKKSDDWRTPFSFLTGDPHFSRFCSELHPAKLPGSSSSPNDAPEQDSVIVLCIPKGETDDPHALSGDRASSQDSQTDLTRIWFEIRPNGELARVLIQMPGSVVTEFRFKDWQVDPPLAESLFHFLPPPGVVIVDGLLPSLPSARQ